MKPPLRPIALMLAASVPLLAAESIPPAAWQRGDERLLGAWRQLTGKFIYQQACATCHKWGPDYWARGRWDKYLKGFPGNHDPDVRGKYQDLTAVFDAGKAVPTLQQEEDALIQFILAAAPPRELAKDDREKPFAGFPEIGRPAPDFAIADVQGRTVSLRQLKDKRALVLVFSRAHW